MTEPTAAAVLLNPCVCLCTSSHEAEPGLCQGEAVTNLVLPWGRMELPVCQACADAIGRRLQRVGSTMPDPWAPSPDPSNWDQSIREVPIREVLSRIDSLTAQLGEYVHAAIGAGATSTEDYRTGRAVDILSGAAQDALLAWDRWTTVQEAPETEEPTPDPLAPAEDRVTDLMGALEASVRDAKEARKRHPRVLTPDQRDAAARHRALQGGDER